MSLSGNPCCLKFDAGTLLLSGLEARAIERIFAAQLWVRDPRAEEQPDVAVWRADARHYRDVRAALQQRLQGRWIDRVPKWTTVQMSASRLPSLRPRQQLAADAWLQHRAGCVAMPTGTGKTEVALQLIARLATSTLVVAPVRDLMHQWHQRLLQRLGIDAGIQGDGIHRVAPLTVTTYDSACIHMPRLGDRFELVVFDGCHHLPGPIRQDAARMSAAPYRLGLTATPDCREATHRLLETLIGPIVYRESLAAARAIRWPIIRCTASQCIVRPTNGGDMTSCRKSLRLGGGQIMAFGGVGAQVEQLRRAVVVAPPLPPLVAKPLATDRACGSNGDRSSYNRPVVPVPKVDRNESRALPPLQRPAVRCAGRRPP